MSTFASERAALQVERLLDYAAFPGHAVLIDAAGDGVLERGDLRGVDTRRLAELTSLFGSPEDDCVAVDPDVLLLAAVPRGHHALLAGLRAGYRLCIVFPDAVAASRVRPRLLQARDRLVAMMRPVLPPLGSPPGEGGAPSAANALWVFAASTNDGSK